MIENFEQFLAQNNISVDDPQVPLLKKAWNAALFAGAHYVQETGMQASFATDLMATS